jgi:hypothetical protein
MALLRPSFVVFSSFWVLAFVSARVVRPKREAGNPACSRLSRRLLEVMKKVSAGRGG